MLSLRRIIQELTLSVSKNSYTGTPSYSDNYHTEDLKASFEILANFECFNQKNDVFRRAWWDDRVRSDLTERFFTTYRQPLKDWRTADGFTQRDYALRNAAWHVSDLFTEMKESEDRREGFTDAFTLQRDPASEKLDVGSPTQVSIEIKRVAKAFGAGLAGITHYDQRWEYVHKFSDLSLEERAPEIPAGLDHVIVVAQPMDYDWINTVPSALSGAATGLGYSHDALVVLSLAQYIRNLGYQAVASMNDTSLAVPYAIKAGLGEYGRHGLLITQEFGPRVRLGKVYTDLPMAHDQPVHFGVKQFCDTCQRCAQGCPVKAIPGGPPTAEMDGQWGEMFRLLGRPE